jgi:hypothetical protein
MMACLNRYSLDSNVNGVHLASGAPCIFFYGVIYVEVGDFVYFSTVLARDTLEYALVTTNLTLLSYLLYGILQGVHLLFYA